MSDPLPTVPPREAFIRRVMGRLDGEPVPRRFPSRRLLTVGAVLACAFALVPAWPADAAGLIAGPAEDLALAVGQAVVAAGLGLVAWRLARRP